MSVFLRKYNTLTVTGTTAIRIPMIKRAVVDFAVSADWTPAGGDVKIAIDGAAAANVTNLPTAVAMGNTAYWEFILTAAELTSKSSVVTIADSATKAVEDNAFIVETFGNASAMYPIDLSDVVRLGLTALPNVASGSAGAIPTTGTGSNQISVASGQVILQTGSGTGQLDFTSGVVKANATQWLGGTIPAVNVTGVPLVDLKYTLGTLSPAAAGSVGVDWAQVANKTSTVGLTGTTISTGQTITSVSGAVGSVTGAVGSVTGAVGSVTGAVGSVTGAVGSVTGAVGSVTGAVGSVTGNVGGSVASVTGAVGSVTAAVTVDGTSALTEAYSSKNGSLTLAQALHELVSFADNRAVASTTVTVKKRDGSTTAKTLTLDSATAPTSTVRAT